MKLSLLFLPLFFCLPSTARDLTGKDKNEILTVLRNQQAAWNEGDIAAFMNGYWKSDSLKFIGKKGLTYGWQNTLDNYRKSYPDKKTMGILEFEIISVEGIGTEAALVIGKWSLKRDNDHPAGYFSLVWKRVGGEWVIVADHSS